MSGDRELLEYACYNLLTNAVKYSPQKTDVTVSVAAERGLIRIAVRDQGIGIPQPELKRIFNRFYRVQNPATGQVKGTVLGLFIVRAVARRYGGDAFAESAGEGRGSTFTLTLPRVYRA